MSGWVGGWEGGGGEWVGGWVGGRVSGRGGGVSGWEGGGGGEWVGGWWVGGGGGQVIAAQITYSAGNLHRRLLQEEEFCVVDILVKVRVSETQIGVGENPQYLQENINLL